MNRSVFQVVRIEPDRVFIVDMDDGGLSVTNDAEAVCEQLHRTYGNRRIIYRDSDHRWDELVHKAGRFQGFAPYNGPTPSDPLNR